MFRVRGPLAITALAVTLAACSSSTASGGGGGEEASDDPIIIGAAVAESGGFELYDNAQTAGMQYAIDEINAAGGIDGRELQLITADHKSDPTQVAAVTQELLDEGADIIVPTVDYDMGAPAVLTAQAAGKVSIGGAGATEFGMQGLGPLHFNVFQATPSESAALAQFAFGSQGLRAPYLLEDTSIQYSKSLCDEFQTAWEALAGEGTITGRDTFDNSDPSVANQVSNVRGATGTDFVVLCSYPPGGPSVIRQLRTAGVDLPIYGGGAFDGTFWGDAVPDLQNFFHAAMVSSGGDDPNPDVNEFLENVEYEGSPSYALFGYMNIQTIAWGIEQAGTAEGAELAAALETLDEEEFLVGPTSYSADCHAPVERPVAIMTVEGGTARLVEYVSNPEVSRAAC
ncbi:ABC transporter substrate-binding protein [Geodermatophilus ruber]|uniref:Amino acid/amide ABC transporter substrate-binding protein, HAAT family n=1 Tax=Geodermatophilus ruber TaxID=504800 RepID=A0A1I4K2Y4_9ACTN|nr:ABC transporter substrate-binding protein [Geodermatophilus ruber]SFL72873.1 amino acid/amide ABC transporter substrate-binding protein, HAAT family [Geodermatophilus ruber]